MKLPAILVLLIHTAALAQQSDNAELQKMYDEDQQSRRGNINWSVLSKQDSVREHRVYEMIRSGVLVTGHDYYNSAMIFQHGRDTLASAMAVKQMKKALALDTTINRWLLAAAIDRDLMRRNKPQIYGTQYVKMNNEPFKRYKIDSAKVTDAERRYYHVEILSEQREKERRMNLKDIFQLYDPAKSIAVNVALIRGEFKKGKQSVYDAGEQSVNELGYDLLRKNKLTEAVTIFKLNTELNPKSGNVWDSYGEVLLKTGKKKEGEKAYRKSLELDPHNENARKILNEAGR